MAEAQYRLGRCYALGKGCEVQPMESVEWMIKAANQGHVRAIQALNAIKGGQD